MEVSLMERLEKSRIIKEDIITKMSDVEVLKNQKEYEQLVRDLKDVDKWLYFLEDLERVEKHIEEDNMMLEGEVDEEILVEIKADLEKNTIKQAKILKQINDLIEVENISPDDKVNTIILEVRAGTGGDEAGMFAADLLRMYSRYCEKKGWDIYILDENGNELGGYKEVVAEIKGEGCYRDLKWEAGVHRVQRVPVTEKQGRIHTSTATVAILPKVSEKEVEIKDSDLEYDFYKSSGKGGQNVQKVETAVRIKHKPSGIVVQCQVERSQLKNKERALNVLRSKLWEIEKARQFGDTDDKRREQVGTAMRCEKIRTYNFPQDRITDHRLMASFHNIESIMEGNIEGMLNEMRKLEDPNFVPGKDEE
jgi:peptide chain release factor 1